MKKIYLIAILLALISFSPTDIDTFYIQRIESLLQNAPGVTYEYLGNGLVKVHYPYSGTMTWDVKTVRDNYASTPPKKIIKLDLRTLDTNLYVKRFRHIATVPIGDVALPAFGAYLSGDSLIELLGTTVYQSKLYPSHIYKRTKTSDSFILVDSLARFLRPVEYKDVDKDSLKELICKPVGGLENGCFAFYQKGASEIYPRTLKYWLNGGDPTVQDPQLVDINNNGYPELIYLDYVTVFAEYDAKTDSVKRKYHPTTTPNGGSWGIADFDRDGKMEVATGNINGQVYFFEWTGEGDNYPIVFSEKTRLPNAYFHGSANDLDGDGRKEAYLGSEGITAEDYVNNIAIYESTGDNQYEVSAWIDIRGVASLAANWIKSADVDGDGKDELIVVIANACIVFKVKANDEYEVFWYKRFYASWSYISMRVLDIDMDGKVEILIGRRKWITNASDDYTELYSFDPLSDVEQINHQPSQLFLDNNFPNPANSSTTIQFGIPKFGSLSFHIYTLEGKLIKEKYIEGIDAGIHNLTLDTSDLPTGLYLYRMQTQDSFIVKKMFILH